LEQATLKNISDCCAVNAMDVQPFVDCDVRFELSI